MKDKMISPPPPIPVNPREIRKDHSSGAKPQPNEPDIKHNNATKKQFLVPNRDDKLPYIG